MHVLAIVVLIYDWVLTVDVHIGLGDVMMMMITLASEPIHVYNGFFSGILAYCFFSQIRIIYLDISEALDYVCVCCRQ